MDTSDPQIRFDSHGVCNHHAEYADTCASQLLPSPAREQALERVVAQMKSEGKGKPYDCVLGLSGGVDSSYMALLVHRLGLRPLVVHFDNGWNSELAVSNIEKILTKLQFDLETYVVDWEEFRDLQVAFLKASVANAEYPTDHGIFACLYRSAAKHGIRYVLSGSNLQSEGILPASWEYHYMDYRHLRAIHAQFGTRPLKTFPTLSFSRYLYYFYVKRLQKVRLLQFVDYHKESAIAELKNFFDWRYYGGKHYESLFTKFHQGFYLPKKFGIDKRRAHLSSLIVSGQITREEALKELEKPAYPEAELETDLNYMRKKLELSEEDFSQILNSKPRAYSEYPNNNKLFEFLRSGRSNLRSLIQHRQNTFNPKPV